MSSSSWSVTRLTFLKSGLSLHTPRVAQYMSNPSHRSSQVMVEEANQKATQMNIMFMETSAKAGHNVKSLFKKIAMSLPGMDNNAQTDTQNASMYSAWNYAY